MVSNHIFSESSSCRVLGSDIHSLDSQICSVSCNESAGDGKSVQENSVISKQTADQNPSSQATTTDESIYSSKDLNIKSVCLERRKVETISVGRDSKNGILDFGSSNQIDLLVSSRFNSQEPPFPPVITQSDMSSNPTDLKGVAGGLKDSLGTKEKVLKMREEAAAKREAVRAGRGQSSPSSARPPFRTEERVLQQSSSEQALPFEAIGQQQQSLLAGPNLPPLTMATSRQSTPQISQPHPNLPVTLEGSMPSLSNVRPIPDPSRSGPAQPWPPPSLNSPIPMRIDSHPNSPTIRSPLNSNRVIPQPLSPAAPITAVNKEVHATSQAQSPHNREVYRTQMQSPGRLKSRAGTSTPEIIPDKLDYQVQEEPERLQVQPALISADLPLPMRTSLSITHTPATPSKLSMQREIAPLQTSTLEPKSLGTMEFIVPLRMRKRILQQYVETINYYPAAVKQIMTQDAPSEKNIEALNELLNRLANVSVHIGLEGGGPSSQDSVQASQEASYAEISSEKFQFLSHLFQLLRNDDLHVALVAQPGHLHDIVELFLKGKSVHYNRPGTYSKSNLGPENGRLHVSLITSTEEGFTTHLTRPADLVIALDETFKAENQTTVDLRKSRTSPNRLTPVIRLIIYSAAEHFDLCILRTLNPIDRLRRLIFCVFHTQEFVGELQDNEPTTQESAERVASFLRSGGLPDLWSLPKIRPVENVPVMDTDSSLSDAMSDVSARVGRPNELGKKYWPTRDHATVGISSTQVLSSGKRPFVSMITWSVNRSYRLLTTIRILSTGTA